MLPPRLHVQGWILVQELLPGCHRCHAIPTVPQASRSPVQDGDSTGVSPAWGLSGEGEVLLPLVVQKGWGWL